ncbi:hypothetical protein WM15_15655 [Burkholderia ubonensis]|nr:hypothetical protein WM15_15655 [Burkholderia ubonensis]
MPDQGFGNGGGLQIPDLNFFHVTDVAIQADRKILVYGSGQEGEPHVRLIRVTSEGALDPSFGDGGIAWAPVPFARYPGRITLLPAGQVICSGHGDPYPSAPSWLLRFTVNGEIDESFGEQGIVPVAPASLRGPLVVVESGHILATGFIDGGSALVAKYRFDGSPEPTFGNGGYVTFASSDGRPALLHALALQPDGKLVAAGRIGTDGAHTTDAVVVRLNSDGAFDGTFNDGQPLIAMERGVDSNDARAVAIQADGRIVVGGQSAATVEGVLFRLEESGAIDRSFGVPNGTGIPGYRGFTYTLRGGIYDRITRLALTLDGNVLALGSTSLYEPAFERQYISKYSL